jgi:hypothetical protein
MQCFGFETVDMAVWELYHAANLKSAPVGALLIV